MAAKDTATNLEYSELDPQFKSEIAALIGGLDLTHCFQCGVCSGSCPTVAWMEYGPRRIMHMVRLGMADEVLRSHDIWFCVSCYSCTARCPQGIEIADVMASLRSLAIAKGLAKDREATFSRVFVEVLERYGRMYEPELLLRYYTAEAGLTGLIKQAGLGLKMLRKGKIALRPERIENTGELGEISVQISGGPRPEPIVREER
ncbi:MAG: 4Fe-4S dicluster domain-containing protein [Chloroflexi bacterium]|nr:4Fe-4S dicluster domain-containing protein [Chloroflexota bacterium]